MPTESTVARPVADQKKKMSKRNKNDTVNESYRVDVTRKVNISDHNHSRRILTVENRQLTVIKLAIRLVLAWYLTWDVPLRGVMNTN